MPARDDLRLLVLGAAEEPRLQGLPGFSVRTVRAAREAVQRIAGGDADCIGVVCQPWPGSDSLRVQHASEETTIPLVLFVDPRREGAAEAVSLLGADAVVDLSWPPALLAQALRASVQRVQTGRVVVDIQRQVLHVAAGQVVQLESNALRDELTGLYNVRHFRQALAQEHARCERHGRSYGLLSADLDNLQHLNATRGQELGSRLLGEVGGAIRSELGPRHQGFRVGGDEFMILMPEADTTAALALAHRLRERVSGLRVPEGAEPVRPSLSLGVASYPAHGRTSGDVVAHADRALLRAKARGKNQVDAGAVP
ncbi:MAG: GGDEF domain-containing protein [Myxococcota bacterium]